MFWVLLSSACPKSRTFQCAMHCQQGCAQEAGRDHSWAADSNWPRVTPCLYGMPSKLRGLGWELMIAAGGQAGYRSVGGEQLYFVLFIYLGFHSSLSLLVMA